MKKLIQMIKQLLWILFLGITVITMVHVLDLPNKIEKLFDAIENFFKKKSYEKILKTVKSFSQVFTSP